jgi:hypothetical protein
VTRPLLGWTMNIICDTHTRYGPLSKLGPRTSHPPHLLCYGPVRHQCPAAMAHGQDQDVWKLPKRGYGRSRPKLPTVDSQMNGSGRALTLDSVNHREVGLFTGENYWVSILFIRKCQTLFFRRIYQWKLVNILSS